MQNVALLNMANGSGGKASSEQLRRTEDLLVREKERNKELLDMLAELRQGVSGEASALEDTFGLEVHPQESMIGRTAVSNQGGGSGILSAMLADERRKNDELRKQLQSHVRQSLEDSDKLLEMSRKVRDLESAASKAKAESCQLKMRLEDMKQQKNVGEKVGKKKKVVNVERLFFDDEDQHAEDKENGQPEEEEDVFLAVPKSNKGSTATAKKTVSFSSEEKVEPEKKAAPAPRQPKARKYNAVLDAREDAAKMEQECAQQ